MTSEKIILNVKKRDLLGKKSKQLRAQGLVLGNINIPGKDSIPVTAERLELKRVYDKAGESSLVYLVLEGSKSQIPVLIKEADFDPLQGEMFHVVFLKVSLKEAVEASIPLEFEGEFKVPGAALIKVKDTVDVSALPTDLPEHFTVNVEQLTEVGQTIFLSDIEIDESKIELILPEDTTKDEIALAIAQAERGEEPEEVTEETPEEEGGEEKKEETPAEEKTE
ncbi:MAG: 50S ribosomal protein L25 [Candidatus Pacebacteria bacterium]|nr:50S ribosomal protein L25 [Candidatus Paceibacterota bacterium]